MRLHAHVETVIADALALIHEPLDVPDCHPEELAGYEIAAMRARVDRHVADCEDVLARLRAVRRGSQSAAELLREEAARLDRQAARHEATAAYCDDRALAVLDVERLARGATRGERVKVPLADGYAAIRVHRSRAVVVDDDAALPPEYLRTVVTPDRRALADALRAGPVPGAHIEERVSESMEWSR